MDKVMSLLKLTGSISSDVVVLVVIFVIFAIYTLYFGKGRTVSLILAYYPALFLYQHLPYIQKLMVLSGERGMALNKAGIFIIIFVLLTVIINRYILSDGGRAGMLSTAGLSLACLILVLVFAYSVVDLSVLHDFGSRIDMLFATPDRVFVGNLVALVLLAFF